MADASPKSKNGVHKRTTKLNVATPDVPRDAADVIGDYARTAARSVTGTARRARERVGTAAEGAFESAREYAGEAMDSSKCLAESAKREVANWVKRNPMLALAAGVGVGLLLGRRIFRR